MRCLVSHAFLTKLKYNSRYRIPTCSAGWVALSKGGKLEGVGKRLSSIVSSPLFRYIVRRLLYMIPVAIGVSIITFVTMYAAGDPINLISLGRNLNEQTKEGLRAYYGLNQPVPVQYLDWLANILRLNFGRSFTFGADVNTLIGNWILYTIELQILSLIIAFLIAIPIGINSAKNQYSKGDLVVTSVSLFGVSMPTFWLGAILIIVFSFNLSWLPSSGAIGPSYAPWWGNPILDHIAHLILPTIVLVYVTLAQNIRLIRANMLEVLRSDYILAARASGLSERKIIYRYALKNAITPTITFLGIALRRHGWRCAHDRICV